MRGSVRVGRHVWAPIILSHLQRKLEGENIVRASSLVCARWLFARRADRCIRAHACIQGHRVKSIPRKQLNTSSFAPSARATPPFYIRGQNSRSTTTHSDLMVRRVSTVVYPFENQCVTSLKIWSYIYCGFIFYY